MMRKPQRRVLAIDVGGSHVKMRVSGRRDIRQFESDSTLKPRQMVARVLKLIGDLKYDAVSIGYPGVVVHGKIVTEPVNLGLSEGDRIPTGWRVPAEHAPIFIRSLFRSRLRLRGDARCRFLVPRTMAMGR